MNFIKKAFPVSFKECNLKGLIISILIYVVVNLVGGFVLGFLDGIPLIGFVFGVCSWILSVYCAVGIVVAILYVLGIIR